MKRKKSKASISISIVLVLVFLFSLTLVFYELSRLSTSKEAIDRSLINAMDSALVEYDEDLYQKYRLMALSNKVDVNELIKERLELGLNNGYSDRASYEITFIQSDPGARLSDAKAMKRAILRSHQKIFLAETASAWLDKLEILEDLSEYSKSMKLFSKSMKSLSKLKEDFDHLREISEDARNKLEAVEALDLSNCVDTIIDEKKHLEELRKEKKGLQQQKKLCKEKEEKEAIDEEITAIEEEIEGSEEVIEELREDIKKVEDLFDKVESFAEKMDQFCKKANEKMTDLKEEIKTIEFEKDDKLAQIMKEIEKILNKIEMASNKISELAEKIKIEARGLEEQIKEIKEHLVTMEKMKRQIRISLGGLEEIDEASLIELFGDKNASKDLKTSNFVSFLWDSITGDYLPDFSELGKIDLESVPHLPSKKSHIKAKELSEKAKKAGSEEKIASNSLDEYEKKAEENESAISKKGREYIQKLMIADYAVKTFNNVVHERSKSEIKAEVEYILSGNSSEKVNVMFTQAKIYSLRMVLNGISILAHKQKEINEMASIISSSSGLLGYPIVYGLISLGWSAIESAEDLKLLNHGKSVPILKKKDELLTDISGMTSDFEAERFKNEIRISADDLLKDDKKSEKKKIEEEDDKGIFEMDYEDHLCFFLFLENEEESLLRISDLICLKENIDCSEYTCAIHTSIKVKIPIIFGKARKEFLSSDRNSYTYESERVRGY